MLSGAARTHPTKSNWEGTGVTPDVVVPQEQALLTAQIMAMHPLVAKLTEPWRKEGAAKVLTELQAKLDAMKTPLPK